MDFSTTSNDGIASSFGSQSFVKVGRLMGVSNMTESFASSGSEAEDDHVACNLTATASLGASEEMSGSFDQESTLHPLKGEEPNREVTPLCVNEDYNDMEVSEIFGDPLFDPMGDDTSQRDTKQVEGQKDQQGAIAPEFHASWLRASDVHSEGRNDESATVANVAPDEGTCTECDSSKFLKQVALSVVQAWTAIIKAADDVPQAPVRLWLARLLCCLLIGAFMGGGVVYVCMRGVSQSPKVLEQDWAGAPNTWKKESQGRTQSWSGTDFRGSTSFKGPQGGVEACIAGGMTWEECVGDVGTEDSTAERTRDSASSAHPVLLEEIKEMLAASGKDGGLSAEQLLRLWTTKRFNEEPNETGRSDDPRGCNECGINGIPRDGPTPFFGSTGRSRADRTGIGASWLFPEASKTHQFHCSSAGGWVC
ncbi:unnamed protein product [Choristocarpus tenellus]